MYVWLVPSESVLDQPGSWRIRKWDTEPFPEANFALSEIVAPQALLDACELLLDYRRRNTANFQLEKADDYLKRIDEALDGVRTTRSATASNIMQVLPLAPQPETVTTATEGPMRYVMKAKFDDETREIRGELSDDKPQGESNAIYCDRSDCRAAKACQKSGGCWRVQTPPSSVVANEGKTPRTDAELANGDVQGPGAYRMVEFARQLEREVAAGHAVYADLSMSHAKLGDKFAHIQELHAEAVERIRLSENAAEDTRLSATGTNAAQIAFDQQSDDPQPGDWNAACRHIAEIFKRGDIDGERK